jgi:hypothetical protein
MAPCGQIERAVPILPRGESGEFNNSVQKEYTSRFANDNFSGLDFSENRERIIQLARFT